MRLLAGKFTYCFVFMKYLIMRWYHGVCIDFPKAVVNKGNFSHYKTFLLYAFSDFFKLKFWPKAVNYELLETTGS